MGAVDQSPPAVERRVAPDATQPRPRRRRPANAWVLMLLAGVVAALAAYAALRDDSAYYLAASAARELPAGATLTDDAITFTELRVAEEVAATVLLREQAAEVDGWVLTGLVPAGALISRDALRPPSAPSELRAMSLALPADHAVGGSIVRGDRVDLIEVAGDQSSYVAVDVEVLAVGRPGSGPVAGAAGSGHTLTVAVDDETALVLARAVEHNAVHAVRATGSTPATLGQTVSPRRDGLGADGLSADPEAPGDNSPDAGAGDSQPEELEPPGQQ